MKAIEVVEAFQREVTSSKGRIMVCKDQGEVCLTFGTILEC